MEPKVTVIIPTYNCSKSLFFALQSLQMQKMGDFEALVIGDGCTDDSESVVSSFRDSRFSWINLPKRIGIQSGPNNHGIQKARGEYIAYLGHDDLWFPWHLENLLSGIESGVCDLMFGLCARITPNEISLLIRYEQNQLIKRSAPPSSWLHRKELIQVSGPWNCYPETLDCPVDFELWKRICLSGKIIDCFPSLSVIKFPSASWRPYAPTNRDLPQKDYMSRIIRDAHRLQMELLNEMSFRWSDRKIKEKSFFRILVGTLVRFYGIERFPFPQIQKWLFQRNRKARFKMRGL